MIDTHSHLLPGLDDGSPDLASSLRMAEAAVAAGVDTALCTPHLRDFDLTFMQRARQVFEGFDAELTARGIALKLIAGFEVDVTVAAEASDAELRLLAIQGGHGLLLVETPHRGWPVHFEETLFRMRTMGFLPLLAHPERNDRIQADPTMLRRCLDAGAVAQATAASMDGGFGRASRAALIRHLERGDISVLATDAHFHRTQSWTPLAALETLRRRLSSEDVEVLTRVNPRRLLEGKQPLPVVPSRRGSWRGLGGRW